MKNVPGELARTLAVSVGQAIDELCDRFDAAWRPGQQPAIEEYLEVSWEEPQRANLLSELLLLELQHRGQTGTWPVKQEYVDRFPEHASLVSDVFDRWAVSEQTVVPDHAGKILAMKSEAGDLHFHARGSCGLVYRAEDRTLGRVLAVKFIREDLRDRPARREQFLLEAELTSRLEHPGIPTVYGRGETPDGRLFYAMRFVQGETLDAAIRRVHQRHDGKPVRARDGNLQLRKLVERFYAVCQVIAYAHDRGIVNRDIKPEHAILGCHGETTVVDWGLAMYATRPGVLPDSSDEILPPGSITPANSHPGISGTPAYMSPEQALGNQALTPASDVYSLGATLYKILCGESAFQGTVVARLSKTVRGDFKRPREINRHVSQALEAICLKAMSLDPRDRYPSAAELARDIESHLADEPVSAYQESLVGRLARWTRRHPTLTQGIFAGLLLTAIASFLAAALGM